MPFLSFHVSTELSPQEIAAVAQQLTDLTTSVLGKRQELTAIECVSVKPTHWFIGGQRLQQKPCAAFYLDVKVTEGTNTKAEKAEYVRRVFDAMQQILGALDPACYIVIHEVHADAWGYAGQTQEFRYIRGLSL